MDSYLFRTELGVPVARRAARAPNSLGPISLSSVSWIPFVSFWLRLSLIIASYCHYNAEVMSLVPVSASVARFSRQSLRFLRRSSSDFSKFCQTLLCNLLSIFDRQFDFIPRSEGWRLLLFGLHSSPRAREGIMSLTEEDSGKYRTRVTFGRPSDESIIGKILRRPRI